MTLIFYGNDNNGGGGGGGSTSVSFTYPYSAVWIYKRSLIDAVDDNGGEVTDAILKQHFVCNLGMASDFENVDESSLSCSYNGKTLELYEDTDENSETVDKTIGTYNNEDVITLSLTNMMYANGSVISGIWYFNEFKEYIMGIQPEPEPGPL